MKKALAFLLAVATLLAAAAAPSFALQKEEANLIAPSAAAVDYTVTGPYDNVDWSTWGAYKFQPHCHTNASDGYMTIKDAIQWDYDLDYDVVAITDHGTLNRGWNKAPQLVDIMRLIKYERTQMAPIDPIPDDEYQQYLNGTHATTEGNVRTSQNGMLDVPLGIELNLATPKCDCHLTGYWSEYGQGYAGVYGDYETPSKGVMKAGGISMLSHVGEYVYPEKDTVNHTGQKIDEYFVNKFARIFLDCKGSSVGMGINSATDCHTRCDRILYDQILQKTIPNGVIPWGFSFSDSHNVPSRNDAYTMLLMPVFDLDHVRTAMETGASFSVSHFSYGVELNGMPEMPAFFEDGFTEDQVNWRSNNTPLITYMNTDNEADTITVEGTDFDQITWVSNGNVILRESVENGKATLDLHSNELLDEPSLFIRFYVTGKDGICYSQPMVLTRNNETFAPVEVPKTHDTSTFLRTLVTVLDWAIFKWSPIVWAFKIFAMGYNPFQWVVGK